MARKPNHVQLSFRIDKDMHQKLVHAAQQHRTTVNAEMKWRIDRSFEQDRAQEFEISVQDFEVTYHRYADRFLELDLQDDILSALAERNYDKASTLAITVLKNRESRTQERLEKTKREAEALARGRAESEARIAENLRLRAERAKGKT
jgi:hypothetical protein